MMIICFSITIPYFFIFLSAETPTGPMGSTSKFIIPSSAYPPNS